MTFRVVLAADRIGALDSMTAGVALARGFAANAQVAVVPIAAGGPDLANAFASLVGSEAPAATADRWVVRAPGRILLGLSQPRTPNWRPDATTSHLGEWVAANVREEEEVVLDLTGLNAQDGGAGLLAAARSVLEGRRLVGVVAADELALPATGIGGGLAKRAFADRVDVADLLRADAALVAWADRLAPGLATAPGGGAAGTTALAVLALGGELVSGTQFCHRQAGLGGTLAAADLVVTGCSELSALDRGGPVVSAVTGWAADAQLPCVLFTTGAGLARRELRTLGLEAAHLLASATPSEADLTAAAARIATGWVST
ncbi:MAG TPA: glycerate kinase [Propionicimonas sp.]|nr:glycerate kinase [Propionicimonas sp.]